MTVKLKLGGLLWVVVAAVAALIGAARGLLDGDTLELAHESLDLVVGAGDEVGARVDDSVLSLIFVELDEGSPKGLVRVLVGPGDGAGEFEGVEQVDVEGGLATVTEGELERAGLDEVLFFGSPNEGVLLDVEATDLDSGEGEAKLTASQITVKDFSAIADGNVVGVDIAIDTEIEVGEVEWLVEVIAGERLFRVVGRLVDDEVGGAGVKYDESLFFFLGRQADVDSARPR